MQRQMPSRHAIAVLLALLALGIAAWWVQGG